MGARNYNTNINDLVLLFTDHGTKSLVYILIVGLLFLVLAVCIRDCLRCLIKDIRHLIRRRRQRRVGAFLPVPGRQDHSVPTPRSLDTVILIEENEQSSGSPDETVIQIEEEDKDEPVSKTWLQAVSANWSGILRQTVREIPATEKFMPHAHTAGESDESNNPIFEVNHNEVAVFRVTTAWNGAIQASMAEDEDEPGAIRPDNTDGFEIQTDEDEAENGTTRSGRETGTGLDDDDVEQVVGNSMLTTVQKVTTLEIFALAQAEGGWWRKKLQNYMAGPTIHRALPTTDVIRRQGLKAVVLDPVNRLVTSMITPDPIGVATFDRAEYEDQDQGMIKEEMTRLTTANKSPGIRQAEGNEHCHYKEEQEGGRVPVLFHVLGIAAETAKEEAAEKKVHLWDQAAIEEVENREYEHIAKKLEAIEPSIVSVHGMEPAISTSEIATGAEDSGFVESMGTVKGKTEIRTSSPSAGGSSTNGQDMTPEKKTAGIRGEALPMLESLPAGIRTTLQACGIPIELNINLQLHGCCHSSATDGESQGMRTQPRVHSYTDLNSLDSEPDPKPVAQLPTNPDLEEQTGTTETGTKIAAGKKGTHDGHCHCSMTGSNFASENNKELHPSRNYGLTSLMESCQAEGSPCGHEEVKRIGLGSLGKQLTAWWGWGRGKDGGSAGSPVSATTDVAEPLLEVQKKKERKPIPEILVTELQQPENVAEAKEEEEEDFEEMEPAQKMQ